MNVLMQSVWRVIGQNEKVRKQNLLIFLSAVINIEIPENEFVKESHVDDLVIITNHRATDDAIAN